MLFVVSLSLCSPKNPELSVQESLCTLKYCAECSKKTPAFRRPTGAQGSLKKGHICEVPGCGLQGALSALRPTKFSGDLMHRQKTSNVLYNESPRCVPQGTPYAEILSFVAPTLLRGSATQCLVACPCRSGALSNRLH